MIEKLESIALPSSHLRLKRCRHGVMLFNTLDQYVGASLDRYGEFAELEAQLFSGLIKPGMLVVEVGANIGAHTVHLAKLVGENGGLVAFEPQRMMYQMLCANLALNGIENTDAKCLALGAAPGEVIVPPPEYLSAGQDGDVVELNALDNFMLPACHMLKISTRAMAKEILDGARETITRFRPLLYLRNDQPEHHAALIAAVLDLEYRIWWHMPWLFNPSNLAGEGENILPGIASLNLICLPRESAPDEIQGGVEVTTAEAPHPLAS
jgi:FkbM family methyltransferase